jgi:hypothetical protein
MKCPEKTNNAFTTACSNCKLVHGEEPHPSNYPGSSDAKEEIRRRKAQRTQKNTKGNMFSSNYTTPVLSFAAALRNNTEQQQQPYLHWVPVACPAAVEKPRVPAHVREQDASQSVPAPDINSLPLDYMFSVVQQIMTEINGAVSEEERIEAITEIVLNLMK